LCQQCGKPATVHQTTLLNQEKRELHLCRSCAESQGILQNDDLSLPAILQSLIGQHLTPEMDELSRLECPACGVRYMEFRADGRLGCPEDYNVFRGGLEPLLYRVHRGTRHSGKVPQRRPPRGLSEVAALRRSLRLAIEAEDYQEAARIRDLLRLKDAVDERG
jgi:protein arginine kinase activator